METDLVLNGAKILKGTKLITMSASSIKAKNKLSKNSENVVKINETEVIPKTNKLLCHQPLSPFINVK
ncbi:hypothetical protein ABIB40_002699 [Pedobacter sp. UYP30]|uniref:hypothetical protein n=1 Tax=Pedobacter sp. UYP30 TaxID=1756400 RepID=UPI0033935EC4